MNQEAIWIEGHGGYLAARVLSEHVVKGLFTLSGGHIFPLYDGCRKTDIRLIDVRHEQTAVFAAEAWAKVTRETGVAALTAGPGVTNGVSAMTSAYLSGSPILVFGGRAPDSRWGQGSLQELDHVPIVKSITKEARTSTSTEGIARDVSELFNAAGAAHRGPTFLDVPLDLFFSSGRTELPPRDLEALREPEPESIAEVLRLLAAAERPVIVAGSDVYWERAEYALRELVEEARIPVFMNGMGRGVVAADHELAFSRARSLAFKEADLVVVAGTPLDFRLGFGSFKSAQVVHLCDTPERVSAHASPAASAAGDLGLCFRALAAGLERSGNGEWVADLRRAETAKRSEDEDLLRSTQAPIHPGRIYGELRQRLERDSIVVGDGGDYVSYAGRFVDSLEPGCFLEPGPYGCLGTGPGYVLGAKSACPDRQVFLMLGDGAAGFSLGDLDTLVRFEIPFVGIVGNNGCWGLEKHPMKQIFGYHVAAELQPNLRYDEIMKSLGGYGEQVTDPEEIGPAIDRALDSGAPALVNVMTDPEDAYPRSTNLG